jgi:ABC-type branched-subunit amino acid transport system substrate-binding protein
MKRTMVLKTAAVLGATSLILAACGGSDSAVPDYPDCKIGTMLPQTGNLAFLGPPEFAGVDLAVAEIQAAGGPIAENLFGDSGDTSTDIASQTADSHINAGVTAIVGAASSGVSLTVIDKITGADVIHFSPANTSPTFSTYEDNGLYFRTAPSDLFQGAVLAQLMLDEGLDKIGIMALDDAYGTGLADALDTRFQESGGVVSDKIIYNPQAAEFSAEVSQMKAGGPQAIALIGFEESTKIVQEMIKQGVGPDNVKLYLVDGNLSNTAFTELPEGIMVGVKGTLPGAAAPEDFQAKLLAINPDLTDFSYAAESYDTVNLLALAMDVAQSCEGPAVAEALISVSKDGEKCSDYATCAALLKEGQDIDYDGLSGPIEFADNGDPSIATMGVWEYTANDETVPVLDDFVTGTVPTS